MTPKHRRGHRAHARRKHLVDHGAATHPRRVQKPQQRLDGGRRLGAEFLRRAEALVRHQFERAFIVQGLKPGVAGGRAGQAGLHAHVGVVANALLARALCLGHPDQAVVVHDRQPHELARLQRQPLQQRLGNVDDARVAEVTQAERDHLGRELVVALLALLPHIAAVLQITQQAVAGAQGNVQVLGHVGQGQPVWVARKVFEQGKTTVESKVHARFLYVESLSNLERVS